MSSSKEIRLSSEPKPRSRVVSSLDTEHENYMRQEAQQTGKEVTQVVQDLLAGRPPTTENVTAFIDRADKLLQTEEKRNPIFQTDEKTRQTVRDTHEFLEASKNLLIHKTGDNKLQNFLTDTILAVTPISSAVSEGKLSAAVGGEETESSRQMREHFNALVTHSRKVLIELSTSREFRDVITRAADIIARLLDMPVSFTGAGRASGTAGVGEQIAATAEKTKHLASKSSEEEADVSQQQQQQQPSSVRLENREWTEVEEDASYEETSFEVTAQHLGQMELPPDYPTQLLYSSTQTLVTEEGFTDVQSQYAMYGSSGPITGDPRLPKLKVVEKVYAPGTRLTTSSISESEEKLREEEKERQPSSSSSQTQLTSVESSPGESSSSSQYKSAAMTSASNVMSAVQQMWFENVDKEERKRIQADVFALLSKLSAHPDHKQAVQSLFALAGLIWKASPSVESVTIPPPVMKAVNDGKVVLGAFTGGEQNIDRLVHHVRAFATKVQGDPEVERILRKFGKYFIRGIEDPSLIQQAFYRQKIYNLLDRAGFLGERYAKDPDLKEVLITWKLIVQSIANDQDINAFGRTLLKLRDDVSYIDQSGTRRIDIETLNKLRGVVFPMLVEQLHFIPLPVISGDDDALAYKLEDMVLSFYDVLPEHIFIDTETHSDFKPLSDYEHEYIDKTLEGGHMFHEEGEMGTRKAYNRHHAWGYFKGRRAKGKAKKIRPTEKIAPHVTADKKNATYGSSVALAPDLHHRSTAQMVIRAYNIQFAVKNMKFDVQRKKFPKLHLKGSADVGTRGTKGSKVVIRLDMAVDAYQANPFTGAAVSAKIAPLKMKIHDSRHDLFYTSMANLFAGTIRKKAEAAIVAKLEAGVRTLLETMNGMFATTVGQLPGFSIAKPVSSVAQVLGSQLKGHVPSSSSDTTIPTKIVSQH